MAHHIQLAAKGHGTDVTGSRARAMSNTCSKVYAPARTKGFARDQHLNVTCSCCLMHSGTVYSLRLYTRWYLYAADNSSMMFDMRASWVMRYK